MDKPFFSLLVRQLAHPAHFWGQLWLAPMWNRRNAALNDLAFERLALQPEDRVLEVGFGGGYLLERMASVVKGGEVQGADASPAMVDYCARRFRREIQAGRVALHCANAARLPFSADYFARVVSVNSVFYWADVATVSSGVCRRANRPIRSMHNSSLVEARSHHGTTTEPGHAGGV